MDLLARVFRDEFDSEYRVFFCSFFCMMSIGFRYVISTSIDICIAQNAGYPRNIAVLETASNFKTLPETNTHRVDLQYVYCKRMDRESCNSRRGKR